MRISIAALAAGLAFFSPAESLVLAQDKTPDGKQVRKPLAIYQGDGFLSRARSFERDRNNRCDPRTTLSLTLYERGKIQYRTIGQTDLRIIPTAEGDIQADKDPKNSGGHSFSMARKGNNQMFTLVGQLSADRARATGSWTLQTRFNTGRAGEVSSTCVYTFDLARLPDARPPK